MVKSECFYAKFGEEWKVVEGHAEQRVWGQGGEVGGLSKACLWGFPLGPRPSLWVWRVLSREGP